MKRALILLFYAQTIFPITTSYFETRDFGLCKFTNTGIDSLGYAVLSPEVKLLWESPEVYIWDIIKMNGKLFIATGRDGKLYKMQRGKASLFFDPGEEAVLSLACDKRGNIYAGTSPNGIIYRVDKNGRGTVFKETGEEYIWKLVVDDFGNLYAGTGRNGLVLKISKSGKLDTLFQTGRMNVSSLIMSGNYIYAGTGEDGLLFRIDKKGRAMGIYDADENEVTGFCFQGEALFFGVTSDSVSSVYKRNKDGFTETVWHKRGTMRGILCLNNSLVVALGNRLYKIYENGREELLYEFPSDISCLSRGVWVGTSKIGRVYNISNNYAKRGIVESNSWDAGRISRWGRLKEKSEIPEGTKLKIETRVGNTEKPDETWERWIPIGSDGKIRSTPARFLRWRAIGQKFEGKTPRLKFISVAYVSPNRKPIIKNIAFLDGKISFSPEDPDGDSLVFDIFFKEVGDKQWIPLAKTEVDTVYTMQKEQFPDGLYQFKVIAKDSPTNPEKYALEGFKISTVYLIDNTPPAIKIRKKGNTISITVADNLSDIESCEYSLNGGKFKPIFPQDGIFDSLKERFLIHIPDGTRICVVRVRDKSGNVSLAKKKF
jgi:hypothetical protein